MSNWLVVVLVIVIIVVVGLAVYGAVATRRRRLRERFGPEYDRVVAERDGRSAAERELRERERRHADLDIKPLSDESRARYAQAWQDVQAQFVDQPGDAVNAAHELMTRLIAERGYPTDDYDERMAQLSVDHASTLGHYRDANEISMRHKRGEAETEDLRQALVHYRALFADLLGDDPVHPSTPARHRTTG